MNAPKPHVVYCSCTVSGRVVSGSVSLALSSKTAALRERSTRSKLQKAGQCNFCNPERNYGCHSVKVSVAPAAPSCIIGTHGRRFYLAVEKESGELVAHPFVPLASFDKVWDQAPHYRKPPFKVRIDEYVDGQLIDSKPIYPPI